MKDKLSIDSEAIKSLAEILVETNLTEIEYENEGKRIRVARTVSAVAMVPQQTVSTVIPHQSEAPKNSDKQSGKQHADNPGAIKSPMVGTVYVSSEPGTPPFVKVGDSVTSGQTLLIIEAMKVMNPIKSPRSGKIAQIFVRDAQPVEFGEPLLVIE